MRVERMVEKVDGRRRNKAEYMRKYRQSPKGKEVTRKYKRKYRQSPKGKEYYRKYQQEYNKSSKGKKVHHRIMKRYRQSPKGKKAGQEYQRRYVKSRRGKEVRLRYHLQHTYGISLDKYNRLCEKQHNRCAICFRAHPGHKRLCVDHSHTTGKVRGLLCHNCNLMLGVYNDSILVLQAVIRYLEKED
jgi:hypothetical protein